MAALSRTRAEPDDPLRGMLNDFFGVLGLPNLEEAFGTPADWAHKLGVPTPQEIVPSPADALDTGIKGVMGGNAPRLPPLPQPETFMPPLPNGGLPRMFPSPPGYGQNYYQSTERKPSERVIRK
jgi:hypothetical protein